MKKIVVLFSITVIFLFLCGIFFNMSVQRSKLTGTVEKSIVTKIDRDFFEFCGPLKIKNDSVLPIRICGGQLNWCNQTGCYRITTPFPIVIQPRKEASITIVITPRGNSISETEITLYADGQGLEGLIPIVVRLPVMSR